MKTGFAIFGFIVLLTLFVPAGGNSDITGFIQLACVIAAICGIAYEFFKTPK